MVGRIIPFNHPFMFCAGKSAAPLAAGNTVVVKPPEQAPLSSLRLAELIGGLLPPGVFNVVPGGREAGQRLAGHPDVAMIALIGSVPTGRAVMRAASDTVKPVHAGARRQERADRLSATPTRTRSPARVIGGMNFTWCGQSCGSTSRAFIHETIYDAVIARVKEKIKYYQARHSDRPRHHHGRDRLQAAVRPRHELYRLGQEEGAQLITGGGPPDDPALKGGFYIEPTVFAVTDKNMRIAREEIFGPVLGVFKWSDEAKMLDDVNAVEYGLTASIWTNDLSTAHRTALAVQAGFVWINEVGKHFLGAPFGGFKQSGLGREECFEEMLAFTQEKNIHVKLKAPKI